MVHARSIHLAGLREVSSGRVKEGLALIRRSIELAPSVADFHSNYAAVLGALGQHSAAADELRTAIRLDPSHPEGHHNLGLACEQLGQRAEAERSFREAGRLKPDYIAAWARLGDLLRKQRRLAGAADAYREILRLDSRQPEAQSQLASVSFDLGKLDEGLAATRDYLRLAPTEYRAHSGLLYRLHYSPHLSPPELFSEHVAWAKRHAEPLRSCWRPHDNDRSADRRLRIGYVSPDFRRHSVATFFEPLLTHHDHQQFEITLYSLTDKPDDRTKRLWSKADRFIDLSRMSDQDAADLIRRERIDILVDLTGHMGGNRLLIFARRPAPIQITYVGHPNTTGMAAMDYRLTDAILDPPGGGSDALHTEKLIRLPFFGCYQPPDEELPVSPSPCGNSGPITFGSLNNPLKITERAVELWCQILRRVPQSRLVLLANTEAPHLRTVFSKHGISPDDTRVEIIGRMKRPDYFRAFGRIDIALDTFPYNGQTTTCDGFWMGVPVIALEGSSYVSRMGKDLLHNVGLPALVARNGHEYVSIAVSLANNRPGLSEIRRSLRQTMQSSPLLNGEGLARQIEDTYRRIWLDWAARGRAP